MNLAQKIAIAVTLLVVVVFLLAGGYKARYSGSHYVIDGFGQHRESYTFQRTDWTKAIIGVAVILAAGGAGVLLFRSKKAKDGH